MATKVFATEDITLQNDKDVTIAPLPIGRLRVFMREWNKFGNIESEDDAFDIYITCCGIALENELREDFPVTRSEKKDEVLNSTYREYLEEVLDIDTIYKILDVSGGLKLTDPKVTEEAERILRERTAE